MRIVRPEVEFRVAGKIEASIDERPDRLSFRFTPDLHKLAAGDFGVLQIVREAWIGIVGYPITAASDGDQLPADGIVDLCQGIRSEALLVGRGRIEIVIEEAGNER